MPHVDSGHWLSIYYNDRIDFVAPGSVDDLVAIHQQLMLKVPDHLLTNLPEGIEIHSSVQMDTSSTTPTAELYVPEGPGPFPVFVHIHGGGWYTGSAAMDRRFGMEVASRGFIVVNVDYALAPKHAFPSGLEDCLYAVRWASLNISQYKGDPSNIFLGGGSAGANLSAGVALALHGGSGELHDRGLASTRVRLRGLILMYGVLDVQHWLAEPKSWAGEVEVVLTAYLGPDFRQAISNPFVSPIESPHLSTLPPVYISCGSEDGLLSNSLKMVQVLSEQNVSVTGSIVSCADHEFLKVPEFVPGAQDEFDRIVDWMLKLIESS